jgi:pyruvate dehydrogenase E2 component (dihydrolipoamide acetyltransferase)
MVESKTTAPHFYLQDEIRADALVASRERRNAEETGRRYSLGDLVLYLVARTLAAHPEMNITIEEDAVVRHDSVDLAFAVSLPNGLVAPVVRRAHTLDLATLHETVRDLARRAREGELSPEEYQGGTFTVSNLGAYGIACFSAVINPPQGAILAVAAARRAVFADEDGAIRPGWSMWVTLSCDHRGIDGAVGAAFLKDLRAAFEGGV